MWYYLVIFFYLTSDSKGDSSPYYCADLNPQPHVIIPQLMGMWYGVEIIDHREQRHYKTFSSSCPIIHISEDEPSTTINPLYKNYNHSYGYGRGQGYGTPLPQYPNSRYPQYSQYPRYSQNTQPKVWTTDPQKYQERSEYDRLTTYSNYPLERRTYNPQVMEMKYLRLYWDESSSVSTEYHLRYNISRKGFWISSGPEVGMSLDPKFSHFAGTVQVLKAVGSHLVLNFCHRIPENQLYTVILAREVKLDAAELHSIHSLLHRRGLSTHAVKKVCNNNGNNITGINFVLLLVLSLICRLSGLSFL